MPKISYDRKYENFVFQKDKLRDSLVKAIGGGQSRPIFLILFVWTLLVWKLCNHCKIMVKIAQFSPKLLNFHHYCTRISQFCKITSQLEVGLAETRKRERDREREREGERERERRGRREKMRAILTPLNLK